MNTAVLRSSQRKRIVTHTLANIVEREALHMPVPEESVSPPPVGKSDLATLRCLPVDDAPVRQASGGGTRLILLMDHTIYEKDLPARRLNLRELYISGSAARLPEGVAIAHPQIRPGDGLRGITKRPAIFGDRRLGGTYPKLARALRTYGQWQIAYQAQLPGPPLRVCSLRISIRRIHSPAIISAVVHYPHSYLAQVCHAGRR